MKFIIMSRKKVCLGYLKAELGHLLWFIHTDVMYLITDIHNKRLNKKYSV